MLPKLAETHENAESLRYGVAVMAEDLNHTEEQALSHRQYLTPKQASKLYPFSASYFTRHAEWFGGMRIGGGDRRAGRWLFTREGIEQSFKKNGRRRENKN